MPDSPYGGFQDLGELRFPYPRPGVGWGGPPARRHLREASPADRQTPGRESPFRLVSGMAHGTRPRIGQSLRLSHGTALQCGNEGSRLGLTAY